MKVSSVLLWSVCAALQVSAAPMVISRKAASRVGVRSGRATGSPAIQMVKRPSARARSFSVPASCPTTTQDCVRFLPADQIGPIADVPQPARQSIASLQYTLDKARTELYRTVVPISERMSDKRLDPRTSALVSSAISFYKQVDKLLDAEQLEGADPVDLERAVVILGDISSFYTSQIQRVANAYLTPEDERDEQAEETIFTDLQSREQGDIAARKEQLLALLDW